MFHNYNTVPMSDFFSTVTDAKWVFMLLKHVNTNMPQAGFEPGSSSDNLLEFDHTAGLKLHLLVH